MNSNSDYPEKYWAGGFLYNPDKREVFLHLRDNNTKFNPNKWAFFGGLNEPADDNPTDCFLREIKEEMGLDANRKDVVQLSEYLNVELNTYRVVFYLLTNISKEKLVLGEGAGFGWLSIDKLNEYDLTEKTIEDIELFLEKI